MPFEAPNDIRASSDTSVSTRQTRGRSQRQQQLADPARLRPAAAPVDLSRGFQRGNLAELVQINNLLKNTTNLAQAGLQLTDQIQEQNQADGRRDAALSSASDYAAFIDEAPTEAEAARRRGASIFVKQGVSEQLGSNAQARAVSSFDASLRQRNIELTKAGERPINFTDDPATYQGFVVEHFQNIAGEAGDGDVFFEIGFSENLDGHVNQIMNKAQERSLIEVNARDKNATAGLYRSAFELGFDDENLEALSTSVLVGIDTSQQLNRRPREELVQEALLTLGAVTMEGINGPRWGRFDGETMSELQAELLDIAGNDPNAAVQVGRIMSAARIRLEQRRVDSLKGIEDASEAASIKHTTDGFKALEEGDSDAYDAAVSGLLEADPLKAGAHISNMEKVREARRDPAPPSQLVIDTLSERIDNGQITSLEQLAAEEANFVTDEGLRINNDEGKLLRKRYESFGGRKGYARDPGFLRFQRDLDGLIRQVGGLAGEDPIIGDLFGGLTPEEQLKQTGLRAIRLRARADVIDFATSDEGARLRNTDNPIEFEKFLSERLERAQEEISVGGGVSEETGLTRTFTRESIQLLDIAGKEFSEALQDRWNFVSKTRPVIPPPPDPEKPPTLEELQGITHSRVQLTDQVTALSDMSDLADLHVAYPDNESSPTIFGRRDFGMALHGVANPDADFDDILAVLNSFDAGEEAPEADTTP
jgi:hypothetical protein